MERIPEGLIVSVDRSIWGPVGVLNRYLGFDYHEDLDLQTRLELLGVRLLTHNTYVYYNKKDLADKFVKAVQLFTIMEGGGK